MKTLDDHYAAIAVRTRPALRELSSVIPNGDSPMSKHFGVHLAARKINPFAPHIPREAIDRQAKALECRVCSAKPGEPCISTAKAKRGAVLQGFHGPRSHDATQKLRKKS